MKAAYEFLAGNSLATPIGLLLAVAVGVALVHAKQLAYAGASFTIVLVATLAVSLFEKPS